MKTKELMQFEVGFYANKNIPYYSTLVPVWRWFQLSEDFKQTVDEARLYKTNGDNEGYDRVKSTLPCTLFTCINDKDKSADSIVKLNPIIVIDIDKLQPEEVEEVKLKLYNLPYVFLVSKSVSNLGVFALAYIAYPNKTTEQIKAIGVDLAKIGITIDSQCTNTNRLRYMSYDPKLYIKPADADIEAYSKCFEERKLTCNDSIKPVSQIVKEYDSSQSNKLCQKAIWLLLNHGFSIDDFNSSNKYSVWYHVACEFHLFDDGHEMFVTFSQNSKNYNDDSSTIEKKWNSAEQPDNVEDVYRKWCGMAKSNFGKDWIKLINQKTFTLT